MHGELVNNLSSKDTILEQLERARVHAEGTILEMKDKQQELNGVIN